MPTRSFAPVAVTLAVLLGAPSAFAQGADAAEADRLFADAKTLAEAGRYAEACPKLEKSLTLDPAIGTEFNLADCYEHVSRNANAYRHYRNVEKAAHVAGKAEREAAAHGRLLALKPKLGWLKLAPAAGTAIATVTVDGESFPPDAKEDLAVDPGARKVEAVSTAQVRSEHTVEAKAGATHSVQLFAPPAAAVAPPPATSEGRGNTQRTLALAAGAVGAAGLVVGGVTGVLAITGHSSAVDACADPKRCSSEPDAAKWDRATAFGNVSTVGFVVGGVAIAAAVVLYVTAPRSQPSATASASPRWDLQGFHF